MKGPRISLCAGKNRAAFTLLEVMVAGAVLIMLLVALIQILDGAIRSSGLMNQQIDAIRDARMSLDVLCADLDNVVTRDGARILLTGSGADTRLAFLTRSRGPSTSISRFLAVSYSLSGTAGFTRSYAGIEWDKSSDLIFSATQSQSGSLSMLSQGVLAWSISALTTSGSSILLTANASAEGSATEALPAYAGWRALRTSSPDYPDGVRSLQVTLAAMDEASLQRFTGDLATIRAEFTQPPANQSAAALWNAAINTKIRAPVRPSIRMVSKTVDLP